MELPDIVKEINKKAKTTKITTLNRAKSFAIKRYFSGSFGIDYITAGGYAYKRVLLLYGHKSSGKNSQLYQMLAYNQRMCRNCHGILPQYAEATIIDRWTAVLESYLQLPQCTCKDSKAKIFLLLDYEKSLGTEAPRIVLVNNFLDKVSGEIINENEYNENKLKHSTLTAKTNLTDEETAKIKTIEAWIDNLEITQEEIEKIPESDYMKSCGVDSDNLLVAEPKWTDEGIDIVKDVIRSKEVDGIIWDSLQAAIPKYVEQRDAEQNTMGVEAKMNGLLMRQVVSAFAADNLDDEAEAYKPTMFVTSQVRSDLGAMYAKPDSYSGGNALGHHISLALEVKREMFLDEFGKEAKWGTSYYGQRTRIRAEKNKLSSPGDMFVYDYFFKGTPGFPTGQIDHVGEIMNLGITLGLINQRGAYFDCQGKTCQGRAQLRDQLGQDPQLVADLYQEIRKRW